MSDGTWNTWAYNKVTTPLTTFQKEKVSNSVLLTQEIIKRYPSELKEGKCSYYISDEGAYFNIRDQSENKISCLLPSGASLPPTLSSALPKAVGGEEKLISKIPYLTFGDLIFCAGNYCLLKCPDSLKLYWFNGKEFVIRESLIHWLPNYFSYCGNPITSQNGKISFNLYIIQEKTSLFKVEVTENGLKKVFITNLTGITRSQSRIIFLVTGDQLILYKGNMIYIYEFGSFSLLQKIVRQGVGCLTLISSNLLAVQSEKLILYQRIGDQWSYLWTLKDEGFRYNFQYKVLAFPLSEKYFKEKVKLLPLDLPLDLKVEVLKFCLDY
jgi:hypothetical protein